MTDQDEGNLVMMPNEGKQTVDIRYESAGGTDNISP